MAQKDVELMRARLLSDARAFSKSGCQILERTGVPDTSSLRAAALQFQQAAAAMMQLDAMEQTLYCIRAK